MGILKAPIPPETGFALGTQSEGTGIKQHEIYMPNATLLLRTQRELYSIGSHWVFIGSCWALLAYVRHYWLASGVALGPQGFPDNNMLVSAMRKSRVGGITPKRGPNARGFALQ